MERFSLTQYMDKRVREVERELYLLRLEEADIQKMDKTCRPGSTIPSPQLLRSRSGIAKKAEQLMTARSHLQWAEDMEKICARGGRKRRTSGKAR